MVQYFTLQLVSKQCLASLYIWCVSLLVCVEALLKPGIYFKHVVGLVDTCVIHQHA